MSEQTPLTVTPAPAAVNVATEALPAEKGNLALGIVGGLAAAVVGSVIWAAIAIITNFEVGYVVVGLAFMVSVAMRKLGRGTEAPFAIAGALCTLFGIALGKVMELVWYVADANKTTVMSVLPQIDWGKALSALASNLQPMDYFFAGLALWLGYTYSIKQSRSIVRRG